MRFITEFELTEKAYATQFPKNKVIEYRKECMQNELGTFISKSFGWANPVLDNPDWFSLEIEAFPMEKWVEFKNRLMEHLHSCEENDELPDTLSVLKMIKELESFGKEQSK